MVAPEDAVYGYDAWDRLKANPDVQAVYIVTPNGVHRDNVVAAAATATRAATAVRARPRRAPSSSAS